MTGFQPPSCSTRREFLTSSAAGGLGLLRLNTWQADEGSDDVLQRTHFAPRAKSCSFIFMDGGPSQLDLFDPKPKLADLGGQQLPESLLKNVRFAFIKKDATL